MKVHIVSDSGEDVKAKLKDKISEEYQKFKGWFIRNRDAIIVFTPIALGGLTAITKIVGKQINLRKQESVKNLYCYDRSLGHYWALRRDLSNREWLSIDQRKKNGERLSDILEELKVLK